MMADIIPITRATWGATREDWLHFDMLLGLSSDLLPVVSNPKATISPNSAMQGLGKTPSQYNGNRQAVGFPQWTQYWATESDIEKWSKEVDYGICLQTRRIRAFDVDVSDAESAQAIREFIANHFQLPARTRGNSPKFLLAFDCPGELYKRRIKTAHGMIELLATGQQFIACGTHPSGVRYEWDGGLPDAIPALPLDQLETLWTDLAAEFGIEAPTESQASSKAQKLSDVVANDPVAQHLLSKGLVKRAERDGRLHVECPWVDEHTSDTGDTSTTYWPAHTGGYINGHFKCLHAHCEHREDHEFLEAVGYVDEGVLSEFEAIADAQPAQQTIEDAKQPQFKFKVEPAHLFVQRPSPQWIIKGVLPRAEMAVVYGDSGSGKTFFILDLSIAVALGQEWRGRICKQGRVVYVAAEGSGGFRNRLKAYAHQHQIELADLPIGVIAAAPNMMEKADAVDVAKSIVAAGGADIVVLDTFAQVMPGANENSGEDVGRALAHCKGIHRATGALVILIHHSGKDSSKGARGWSGLRAAADAEIEVIRSDDDRAATVTKLKDGEDGAEFGFRLQTVVVGLDSDDEEITSCVLEHNDGGARAAKAKKVTIKGDVQRLVVSTLTEMIGIDAGGDGVDREELISAVVRQMDHEGGRDRREFRVVRALEGLRDAGVLVANGCKLAPSGNL